MHSHKELNEAISRALEFEAAKKSSEELWYMHHVWTVSELKEDNSVMEVMKDIYQKYSYRKPWREERLKCYHTGTVQMKL